MLLNELIAKIENIKKGTFARMKWRSEKQIGTDHCEKISVGTIRLVNYAHINGVEPKGQKNPNENKVSEFISYNENTKKYSLMVGTTENKPIVIYKVNGEIVNKEIYEKYVKPNPNKNKSVVFKVYIENVLEIGE